MGSLITCTSSISSFVFFIDFYVNLILTRESVSFLMRVKGDKSCRSGRASIRPASYRRISWRIRRALVLQVLTDTLFSGVHSVNKTLQMLSLHNISFSFIRPKSFFFTSHNMQYDFFSLQPEFEYQQPIQCVITLLLSFSIYIKLASNPSTNNHYI